MKSTYIKRVHKTLAFGLTGLGLVVANSAMAGTIVGSQHDFSTKGWSGGEICVACHTPHHAQTVADAPLWNHAVTTATHTLYASPTFDGAGTIGNPDGASLLCLSCHDGTLSMDAFGGNPGTGDRMPGGGPDGTGGGANLGTHLANDHPISFTYDSALAQTDPGLFDPSTKTVTIGGGDKTKSGTINDIMLYNGKLQCPSCHDVHNGFTQQTARLLKVTKAGSAICLVCHDK